MYTWHSVRTTILLTQVKYLFNLILVIIISYHNGDSNNCVFIISVFIIIIKCIYNYTVHFTEDIDPSIGRFRNLVSTTVIPNKVRYLFQFIKNTGKLF